ncbi:MAG: N-acetylmuramoyl-L-alanine amidase [Pseudomonadota bacterium]
MQIVEHPSPNHGPRKDGAVPDMVVLHYTAMDSAEAALERLCDPEFEVSAHYMIAKSGALYRLVAEEQRAWHAGRARWGNVVDVNSRSIGIELDNDGTEPFGDALIESLLALLTDIVMRHAIRPERVVGHSDIAPDRKGDPGAMFPWERLVEAGFAVAVEPGYAGPWTGEAEARFRAAMARVGFDTTRSTETLLRALQLRHAPMRLGCSPGYGDLALAEELAAAYPCIDG